MSILRNKILITLLSALLLTSCTSAMYSDPSAVAGKNNQYEFFIATGGFSGAETADKRAVQEINKFMAQRGFRSYKIVKRTDKFVPSGFDYIVQFNR